MSFHLTDDETKLQSEIAGRLRETWEAVEKASRTSIREVEQIIDSLNDVLADYNNVIVEANGFREAVVERLRSILDDSPETWLESTEGQAAEEFINKWETAYDQIPLFSTPDIDVPTVEDADSLSDLPAEPEE